MRFTLKKSEILRGSNIDEHLLNHSKKIEGSVLRCYMTTKPEEAERSAPAVLVAFAVKKFLKRAVDRNLVRRRMREAYRLHKHVLYSQLHDASPHLYILFVYSAPKQSPVVLPSYDAIRDDMIMMLTAIAKRIR